MNRRRYVRGSWIVLALALEIQCGSDHRDGDASALDASFDQAPAQGDGGGVTRDLATSWCASVYPELVAPLETMADASTCDREARSRLRDIEVGCSCLFKDDHYAQCLSFVARFDSSGRLTAIDPPGGDQTIAATPYTRCLQAGLPDGTWPCLAGQQVIVRAASCTLP